LISADEADSHHQVIPIVFPVGSETMNIPKSWINCGLYTISGGSGCSRGTWKNAVEGWNGI